MFVGRNVYKVIAIKVHIDCYYEYLILRLLLPACGGVRNDSVNVLNREVSFDRLYATKL